MNKLIARLIDCGMTRDVVSHMYGVYKLKGISDESERYVESAGESSLELMEDV